MSGIVSRFFNFFRGLLSMSVSDLERSNPKVAYESAIEAAIKKLNTAQSAVASIIANRQTAEARLKKAQTELAQTNKDLEAALATDQDDIAALLIQKQEQLELTSASAQEDLERLSTQAEESKQMLLEFKGTIGRLRAERDEMLARHATASAQIQLQDQLSGLSVDAEIRALDNVREGINHTVARAALGKEMAGTDIEHRLVKLRQESGSLSASAKVKALKAARAASENKTL